MDQLVINGGQRLVGSLTVSGSKNSALALMAAALLADGKSTIRNIPALRDISTFSQVMRVTGAGVDLDVDTHVMTIDGSTIASYEAPYELVKKMRASFYMLGALLGRFGEARVSLPGGCAWGPRPVDLHLKGMEALGAEIKLEEGYVVAKAPGGRLKGGTFTFEPSSVGATINLFLAAVLAEGETTLNNVAIEPDVIVFGEMLVEMGADISGLGSRTVTIRGVESLTPVDTTNCPDRIEMGTFMLMGAMATEPGIPFEILGGNPDHLGAEFIDLFDQTGVQVEYGHQGLQLIRPDELRPVSISTGIYPGFPTDLQAQWTILLTQAKGESTITDTIYFDRFAHIPELRRMGAQASVAGNVVTIQGGDTLSGAKVMSTDLRASVSLVMAGMVAEGTTEVLRIYHLDRGYERLELKLAAAGIDIRRERYDEFEQPVPHIV